MASPWNLILTKETNGFLCFHIFLCKDGERGEKKRKVETFLFLTRETIPPPPLSSNKFQRGEKKEIVGVQINRDWDSKVLENSYDSLKSTLSTRFTFHVLKKEQVYQFTFCRISHEEKPSAGINSLLTVLSLMATKQKNKIYTNFFISYGQDERKNKVQKERRILSFLLWRQNKKIKYTRISSYRMAKMKENKVQKERRII